MIRVLRVKPLLFLSWRFFSLASWRPCRLSSAPVVTSATIAPLKPVLSVVVPSFVSSVRLTTASVESAPVSSFVLARTIRSEFCEFLTDLFLAQIIVNVDTVVNIVSGPVQLHPFNCVKLFLDALLKLGKFSFEFVKFFSFDIALVFQEFCLILQNLDLTFKLESVP